jgi:micrococcal nuclease
MSLSLLLAAVAGFTCSQPFFHDGDNIRCGGRQMRLAAIDAPELTGSPKCRRHLEMCDQVAAVRARDYLRSLAVGQSVTCQVVDASPRSKGFQAADRFGRPVVRCRAGRVDLSDAQLAAGVAQPWPPRPK